MNTKTNKSEGLTRELRNAVRICANPDQFSESLIALSWKMLKQHGVPK